MRTDLTQINTDYTDTHLIPRMTIALVLKINVFILILCFVVFCLISKLDSPVSPEVGEGQVIFSVTPSSPRHVSQTSKPWLVSSRMTPLTDVSLESGKKKHFRKTVVICLPKLNRPPCIFSYFVLISAWTDKLLILLERALETVNYQS